jgi:hypothetical protein
MLDLQSHVSCNSFLVDSEHHMYCYHDCAGRILVYEDRVKSHSHFSWTESGFIVDDGLLCNCEGRVSARGYLVYETGTLKKGEGTFPYPKKFHKIVDRGPL